MNMNVAGGTMLQSCGPCLSLSFGTEHLLTELERCLTPVGNLTWFLP
jgi:hypothetical protein